MGGNEPDDAVEASARVVVEEEEARCPMCLEGYGANGEAREMPCTLRFRMPVEENKPAAGGGVEEEDEGERRMRRGRRAEEEERQGREDFF
ncbi:hypothetical protein EJ110_NYTH28743 [Nymphaea thermarum]|nr:hypothetical protein EJ110_NYTH28743 [Nymphaea thermarum]